MYDLIIYKQEISCIPTTRVFITKNNRKSLETKCYKNRWTVMQEKFNGLHPFEYYYIFYIETCILHHYKFPNIRIEDYYISHSYKDEIKEMTIEEMLEACKVLADEGSFETTKFIQNLIMSCLYKE